MPPEKHTMMLVPKNESATKSTKDLIDSRQVHDILPKEISAV